jgi:hypothetical protein
MRVSVIIKQPAEIVQHRLFDGAGIVSVASVSAIGRGLVSGSAAITATAQLTQNAVIVELTGGTDGERYLVTVRADDDAGGLREAELEVAVLDAVWATPGGGSGPRWLGSVDRFEKFRITGSIVAR